MPGSCKTRARRPFDGVRAGSVQVNGTRKEPSRPRRASGSDCKYFLSPASPCRRCRTRCTRNGDPQSDQETFLRRGGARPGASVSANGMMFRKTAVLSGSLAGSTGASRKTADPGVRHRNILHHNSLTKLTIFLETVLETVLSRLHCETIRGNTPLVRHVPYG